MRGLAEEYTINPPTEVSTDEFKCLILDPTEVQLAGNLEELEHGGQVHVREDVVLTHVQDHVGEQVGA